MPDNAYDLVLMAEIVGVHGVKGMLKLKIFSETPEDLPGYSPFCDAARNKTFDLLSVQPHGNTFLAEIDGIADRTEAEKLRGVKLYVTRGCLPDIAENNTFYHVDLVGLAARWPDGKPMGKVNFVLRDSKNRIWITISTMVNPWNEAVRTGLTDGYIALVDEKGIRIVADGFAFTNEIRLDEKEEWLYVAETCAKRVTRLRVQPDGSLTDREVYGPSSLGDGLIDGFAFDAYGNLWCTMIFADRLVAITPEGDALTLLDDGDPDQTAAFEAEFATGKPMRVETLAASGGTIAPWLASVTFGGPDLKTVYLGSLKGNTIPYFRSPVAGLPMVHW